MTINLTELERLAKAAPDGPYFAADDAAEDTIPHRNSGLALVDTGRIADSEWPIARLCEWGSANYIAALDPQTVLALIRCARAEVEWKYADRDHMHEADCKLLGAVTDFTLSA